MRISKKHKNYLNLLSDISDVTTSAISFQNNKYNYSDSGWVLDPKYRNQLEDERHIVEEEKAESVKLPLLMLAPLEDGNTQNEIEEKPMQSFLDGLDDAFDNWDENVKLKKTL